MTMQALVIAHAAFGHNHFFKNNYLFRQWTDADGILDYLEFAKRYDPQPFHIDEVAAKVPPDAMMNLNTSKDLLAVATWVLDARLAEASGHRPACIAAWMKAVIGEHFGHSYD